ncbi:hypothetical protein [Mastigocoleus testarum]|uniref:Uncharacterized protein n=1 Tax=Mastigocoleus testarum BC008 TaxID=371196 RepID=A0A0V7ZWC4_9CYAN|nr:hypothetical protein [Mastigocoleus testarum]KST68747.1 hypothetical protein BC008_01955 [Mastigocoleus testarum BC008]
MIRKSKFLLLLLTSLTLTIIISSQKYIQAQEPSQKSQLQNQTSEVDSSGTEIVAAVNQIPGNITVTPDGRIIISLHQFYQTPSRVVEVSKDGKLTPFPNLKWSQGRNEKGVGLDAVLGIQSDSNSIVWMLDNGMRGKVTPQLVGWNTRTNKLEQVISLPFPVTTANSFLNDFSKDGYLYSVINQLHRTPPLNAGKNDTKPPFLIIRIKPLADGIVGR